MSGPQPIDTEPSLRRRTALASSDARLRANLVRASGTLGSRKAAAFGALDDPEGLRHQARAIRHRVLARLPEVLEALADRVEAAGGRVHWASTAADAADAVVAVARSHGARLAVKSKSMASEEIGLNAALEHAGVEVVETDLGEWIVQVAEETPSHIIVPAIHRDRAQIARTLSTVAGRPLADDPQELAAFARDQLRRRFLEADIGISGVNFGVADTGTLVLVSNEGNGRMVTSMPPVHVALMGMERVVQTWAELEVMLALLPRAATGQAITSYVSLITGPAGRLEEGPEELHLVILDNGRSDILGSEFAEALACIRCGACLNACPVYRQVGGHAYGWVYPGPIGAVLTPLLQSSKSAQQLPQASSLCAACWEACPVGIPLQDLLLGLRRRSAAGAGAGARLAWEAWSRLWSRPATYQASLRAASVADRAAGSPASLPGHLDRWSAGRDLPTAEGPTFRQLWDQGRI
ncbi:MAG TPA: LutB/LldF family L-lactate oxidation iron-sulfur protein [Acidimicrobiales bacterium]|nr:LutB/LldF family L-lactate oxidation iron-sulfur protein [Acidimicrobiales bacterium]